MENETIDENEVWEDLLDELFALNYNQTDEIFNIQPRISQQLQSAPDNISGLITLMYSEVMLGNRQSAIELAEKIWEIGGDLDEFFEFVYVENLLNLGLLDRASILLKPRFEDLRNSIDLFYPSLTKFAVMTGNISLISRIADYAEFVEDEDADLFELANTYIETNNIPTFKNIMRLILENSIDNLCSYEYTLYHDRGFPEIEIALYYNADAALISQQEENVNKKITALWNSQGLKPLDNITVSILPITEHEGWDTEPTED